ncbi:hypothetical protein A1OK_07460 [Enterovibrio norvegicus FF-454]|uniref:Uncharacterized protein n=1 Tax=Enterovibrio norvegicus FF-454 TaxID=1185651 RepID=A0A1E5CAU4_9GAMM|nr:hypothetical protein A1OK_07460 [Enterovibrio norvegicus FF-454]
MLTVGEGVNVESSSKNVAESTISPQRNLTIVTLCRPKEAFEWSLTMREGEVYKLEKQNQYNLSILSA